MVIKAVLPFFYGMQWERGEKFSVPNDVAQRLIDSGDAEPAATPPPLPPPHTPAVPMTWLTESGLY